MTRTIRSYEERQEVWEWANETFNGLDEETGMVLYNPYKFYCTDPDCEPCQDIEEMYDEFIEWLDEEVFGACRRLSEEFGEPCGRGSH